MKHPIRRHVLTIGSVAALALGFAGGNAGAAPVRSLDTAHLVLRLSDLPRNFTLVEGKHESAAQAGSGNGISGAKMRTAGYVSGYLNEYEKKGLEKATKASQVKGLVVAISAVFKFRQSSGAHTAYTEFLKQIPKASSLKGFKMASFPKIGDASQGYTYHENVGSIGVTFDFVLFRHGGYDAIVGGGGAAMTLGKEDSTVTSLVTKINSRIGSNG